MHRHNDERDFEGNFNYLFPYNVYIDLLG